MYKGLAGLVLLFFLLSCTIPEEQLSTEEFNVEVVVERLSVPWSIDFLPDDRMIITERPGRVLLFDNGELHLLTTIDVSTRAEAGLLGVAVDPEFVDNNYVYLYYTASTGNRVVRFDFLDNEEPSLVNEHILLDNIPDAPYHDGGRIKFGPDGKLYITTGDATEPELAQDLNSIAGKILRMNKDGSIPTDNPFKNSLVYSWGHRNPQGLDWNSDGELFSSEHGAKQHDEVNVIYAGQNYGWPDVECTDEDSSIVQPISCAIGYTLAPGGMAFYKGNLYVTGLRGSQLRQYTLADDKKTVIKEEALFTQWGRLRDVVEHKGSLYVATSNRDKRGIPNIGDDKIIRVTLI